MSMRQRDYMLRMIEQLAEAIARIAGARAAGKLDEANLLVRETADGILGPMRSMLERVDAASAATLLGSRDKLCAYAALVSEEAKNAEAGGDAARARRSFRRALELYLEAGSSGESDAVWPSAVRALRAVVDEATLAERYRARLAKVR